MVKKLQKQEVLNLMKKNNIRGKYLISLNEIKCKTNDDFKKSLKIFKKYIITISHGF